MGAIQITKSPEWLGAIRYMQVIDRSFAAALRKYIKAMAEPEWRKAMSSRSRTTLERRVLNATTTIAVSSSNIKMESGGKGRPLSGGLPMSQAAPAVEFGSSRYKQFGPRRKMGPFYRSAENMTPRLASLFSQTIIKTMQLALNGKDPS
jgi:hypothetical protein